MQSIYLKFWYLLLGISHGVEFNESFRNQSLKVKDFYRCIQSGPNSTWLPQPNGPKKCKNGQLSQFCSFSPNDYFSLNSWFSNPSLMLQLAFWSILSYRGKSFGQKGQKSATVTDNLQNLFVLSVSPYHYVQLFLPVPGWVWRLELIECCRWLTPGHTAADG